MANLKEPNFTPREGKGFESLRARLGDDAGSEKLGLSLWEVPPGKAAYPYHWHEQEEEMIIVLAGTPNLRTPDGWRRLEQGEIVSFRVGEQGAHQIVNDTDETIRFLSISSWANGPEICFYPDSDKVGVFTRDGVYELYKRGSSVDYWDGEEPPTPAGSSSA
jgi:uncharacterized cupin superfamily protein